MLNNGVAVFPQHLNRRWLLFTFKRLELARRTELLGLLEADDSMLGEILFSDEAHFHLSGEVNRHNCVYWSTENPQHFTTSPLHSPKLTVWMGVWKGGLIGPYFFEETVSGASYLQMLNE